MRTFHTEKSILYDIKPTKNLLETLGKNIGVRVRLVGCAVCGGRKWLQIHHVDYSRDRTLLLCRSCHVRVHFGKGLEHLNPVGRRQELNYIGTLEQLGEITPQEIQDMAKYSGYVRLLRAITNRKTEGIAEGNYDGVTRSDIQTGTEKNVTIYSAAASIGKFGPGGYGVILEYKNIHKE